MSPIFEGRVSVHYGQVLVMPVEDCPALGLADCFQGQVNGLCGAATAGSLWLITGLHTGDVGFILDILDAPPPLDDHWEEVVEVSFIASVEELALSGWDGNVCAVPLTPGSYRVRYCARGMGQGQEEDDPEAEPKEFYSLSFWPAVPLSDAVVKQTSAVAAYWHKYAHNSPR